MQPKEKERKVKEKGKSGKDGKDGKSGSKDGTAQLADAAQSSTTTATTFYVDHMNPLNFSFMATTEEQTSFIAQPLTPLQWFWIWDAQGRWLREWQRRTL